MIQLFNINDYKIDTSEFSHALHSYHVKELEDMLCEFVGAKYACGLSSATNAIFLASLGKGENFKIPSMIPPVVVNATLNAGNKVEFINDVDWVGDSYILHTFENYKIVDSAQKVVENQFTKECNDEDLMFYSFYPTKPIGSLDGGMIFSNDESKINWFREASLNGMTYSQENWNRNLKFPGWKMYLSSFQAKIAIENFKKIKEKNSRLEEIRSRYNDAFGYENSSYHLYRIDVTNRKDFIEKMKKENVSTGIHYYCAHKMKAYEKITSCNSDMSLSESKEKTTVSIPFHEKLTEDEVKKIIEAVKMSGNLINEF